MDFLFFLEGIRTPALNVIMEVITFLGYETFFMVFALFMHWCVDKRRGYYLLTTGFFGILINQFLKLLFRIPRPWILDENFTIVESARDEAIGYSFPSGHTQNITGIMGSVIATTKKNAVRILGVVIILLVAFSRMYLGVHTPKDVITSLVLGAVLVFALYPFFKSDELLEKAMPYISLAGILISGAYIAFLEFYPFPADIDAKNLSEGIEAGYKIFGAGLAMTLSFFLEKKYINFKTKATPLGQVLKLVLGLCLTLGLKGVLEPAFAIFGLFGKGLEYAFVVLFAATVWPMTFKFFENIGKSKNA